MKKVIYLFFVLAILIFVGSCKKTGGNVNPLSDVSNLGTGAYLTLDSTINLNLDFSNLAASKIGIQVSQAPAGQAVASIALFVATTSTYDTTQWSKIKTVPYTGPKTSLIVTGQELATALKIPLTGFSPGSNFTFFTRVITKSGQFWDASNTGNDAGTGLVTGSTYNPAFTFTAYIVCPFVGPVAGTYKVIEDGWADHAAGEKVQVLDGPGANEINLSEVYPKGGTVVKPLVVDIDPATGTATVKKVNFGDYGGGTNVNAEGTGTNDVAGYVFSCTGYITLNLDFTNVSGGDYGSYQLILQKVSGEPTSTPKSFSVKHILKK